MSGDQSQDLGLAPIMILSCPEKDDLWLSLPATTFWECVRVALRKERDLRDWSDEVISKLFGSPNEEWVRELRAWEKVQG